MRFVGFYSRISLMDQPLVSIVIPTFNRPYRVGDAIQSVLNQTYPNVEIIVVNDCGCGVEHIIEELNHKNNIRYIRHSANKGMSGARNTGIRNALGKYIGYLDDDDQLYPDHVETLVSFLETNQAEVAYTDSQEALQVQEGNTFRTIKYFLRYSMDFDKDLILVKNFVPTLCFLHSTACFANVEPFDESLRAHEDWDLWMRMSRQYTMHHIPKITSEYSRVTNSNRENTSRNLHLMYETAVKVQQKTVAWVKDRPDLQASQHKLAESIRLSWEIQARNEFNLFVEKLLSMLQENKMQEALTLFDDNEDKFRKGLTDIQPELSKIESMLTRIRSAR